MQLDASQVQLGTVERGGARLPKGFPGFWRGGGCAAAPPRGPSWHCEHSAAMACDHV